MSQFNLDAMRRIAQTVRRVERSPSGTPSMFSGKPPPAPREFLTARANSTVAATTDPSSSANIESGEVTIWEWNATNEQWEETDRVVTAHDFSGSGWAEDAWLQLHRLSHKKGVLWVVSPDPHSSWRGGLDNFMGLTGSYVTVPWVEREFYGARFCTISAGVLTFSRSGTYKITPSIDAAMGTTAGSVAANVSVLILTKAILDTSLVFGLGGQLAFTAMTDAFSACGLGDTMSPTKLVEIEAGQTLKWQSQVSYTGAGGGSGTFAPDIDDWGFGAGSNTHGRGSTLSISYHGPLPL